MPESGNALICNGVVREIKSAVYTVETPGNGEKADASEAASVYTIYLCRRQEAWMWTAC